MRFNPAYATVGLLSIACSATGPAEPDQVASVEQKVVVTSDADVPAGETRLETFVLNSSRAQALAGGSQIKRRQPGFRFTGSSVPGIKFVPADSNAFTNHLRSVTSAFFSPATSKLSLSPDVVNAANVAKDEGLLRLALPDAAMIAFSVPASGAITIKRAGAFDHESVIKTAEEAVNVALNKLAQDNYVTLAEGETLDVAGISATFSGPSPASGLGGPAQKIAYNVMFGRQYKGIPVLGPPVLAVLDADANLSTFRKAWRDIAGEGASVPLATSTAIDSRRDALKSKFLTLTESTCGYTEDPDTNSTQPAAGVGCHYRYFNAAAAGSPGQGQEDWVNAAADGNARMRGLRKAIGTGS